MERNQNQNQNTESEEVMNTLTTAKFMLHAKKYGFQYAVMILLLESTGLFNQLFNYASGVC